MYLADHKDVYLVKNRIGDMRCGKNVYILTNTQCTSYIDEVIQKALAFIVNPHEKIDFKTDDLFQIIIDNIYDLGNEGK